MASLNKVFLIGNLTREPDLRYTPSGAAVCELGLAVNRRFTVNNQDREETCFVDVTVWSKSAENCKRFLEKGSPVMVEGRLQYDTWEDRDGGGKRSRLRVVAEQIQFLGNRRDGGGDGGYEQPRGDYNQQRGGYDQPRGGNYEPRPYNRPGSGGAPAGPRGGQQPMPPMPEAAFNPGTEAEEDIPF